MNNLFATRNIFITKTIVYLAVNLETLRALAVPGD